MKTLKNIFMLCSFAAAMILFATNAQAQSTNGGDKTVKSTEVSVAPNASKSACTVSGAGASSCCKSKGASAAATTSSCHSTVGSGSASNASAGDAPAASKKECSGKSKACCASKAKKEGSSL
jgi:hypothetical protein